MAGSPVVLVLDGVQSGFPSNSTFRQVEVTVRCTHGDTGEERSFIFLLDVYGDTMRVDISSALRSMLFNTDYSYSWLNRASMTYPYVTFGVDCREKYMVDGSVYYGMTQSYRYDSRAVPGRISEMDRLRISGHVADYYTKLRFTAKPTTGLELVPKGEQVATYSVGSSGGIACTTATMDSEGLHTLADGRNVFVVEDDGNLFPLRFVNSMGVMDTATAFCREALSYEVTTESFTVTEAPSNLDPSGMEALKGEGIGTLTLSSGFVTRKWADWWAEEVMRTTKCWVRFGKQYHMTGDVIAVLPMWLPCILTPKDDETVVYDRSSQGLCYVPFEARICHTGSLMRSVMDPK